MFISEGQRDLAIKAALGASQAHLVGLVFRNGLVLTAAGLACGVLLSTAAARGLASFLYRVHPLDAITFAGVPLVMLATSIVVISATALRVRNVDPAGILRSE